MANFEVLQKILETDLDRPVSIAEARKIGRWLLRFYGTLSK